MARNTLFTDDFNRADQPIDGTGQWGVVAGDNTPSIINNEVTNDGVVLVETYANFTLEIDQWCEATMSDVVPARANHLMGLYVRYSEFGRYVLHLASNGAGLQKRTGAGSINDSWVGSATFTPQAGDIYRIEAEGTDIRCYVNDTLIMSVVDDINAGGVVGMVLDKPLAPQTDGAWDDFKAGEFTTGFAIGDINGGASIRSGGDIVITGTLLDTVTEAYLTDGVDPYQLNIISQNPGQITCSPVNVMDTKLPYAASADGSISVSLSDGAIQQNKTVIFIQETGYEYQVLSGVDNTLMAVGLGAQDGDILEVEDGVGLSNLILFADSDVHYDPGVVPGQQHTRRFYDASTKTWDAGLVVINPTGVGGPSPKWIAVPAPPEGSVGTPYSYAIGNVLEGDRPMTLENIGNALPAGLSINAGINPEVIEGTPTTAGTSSGININATNAVAGPASSSPFQIVIAATAPGDTAPAFTETPSAPTAKINTPYHWPIGTIITGTRPITLSGTLPDGLTFADGGEPEAITGTPTTEQTVNTQITATNSVDADTSAAFDIEVRGISNTPLWIGFPSPPNARLGRAIYVFCRRFARRRPAYDFYRRR